MNAVAKVVTAIVQLGMVPIALSYLGQELYGVWMSIAALVAFLQFTDLGVANALIGLVGQASSEHKYQAARQLLKQGLILVGSFGTVVTLIGLVCVSQLPWIQWLNIDPLAAADALAAARVSIVMFCLGLTLGLVQQIRLGLLEGHVSAYCQIVGQILNLVLVYLGTRFDVGLSVLIVLSMAGLQLMQAANLWALWGRLNAHAQVGVFDASAQLASVGHVVRESAPFVVIQVMGLLTTQADLIIISHYLGSDSVATYSVTQKLFGMPELMIWVFLISLWPAYANAKSQDDWAWVKCVFDKSLRRLFTLNVPIALVLLLLGNQIINYWTHGQVMPNAALLSGMAGVIVLSS